MTDTAALDALYLHLPFCRTRCAYCTFYSGEPLDALAGYPAFLLGELDLLLADADTGPVGPLATLYFGGGTPSLLSAPDLSHLIEAIAQRVGLAPGAEVTLEANPGDETDFAACRAAGVTRVSLGVQALDDALLALLGRRHTAAQARAGVAAALRAGLRVSADLLYGYAGLAPAPLARFAGALADLGVGHLSAYALEHVGEHPVAPATQSDEEAQERALHRALAAKGFARYEVSNFARPGERSRHNLAYWEGRGYLGLGPGASSYLPHRGPYGLRRQNARDLAAYRATLADRRAPPRQDEHPTRAEALLEALFLALRHRAPLPLARLAARFGLDEASLRKVLAPLAAAGDLDPALIPTDRGLARADGLALHMRDRLLA